MELDERNIIIDENLGRIAEPDMDDYITHAYCSAGECEVWYGGSQLHFRKGDCMIVVANRQVTRLRPSADFRVSVIYVTQDFINVCATHSNYGTRGGMSLYVNPIMRLNEEEQRLCERDFSEVFRRDQIWFTEKNRSEQTDLYCLTDIVLPDGTKPRNDANYEKNYIAGRYGAVPGKFSRV